MDTLLVAGSRKRSPNVYSEPFYGSVEPLRFFTVHVQCSLNLAVPLNCCYPTNSPKNGGLNSAR